MHIKVTYTIVMNMRKQTGVLSQIDSNLITKLAL